MKRSSLLSCCRLKPSFFLSKIPWQVSSVQHENEKEQALGLSVSGTHILVSEVQISWLSHSPFISCLGWYLSYKKIFSSQKVWRFYLLRPVAPANHLFLHVMTSWSAELLSSRHTADLLSLTYRISSLNSISKEVKSYFPLSLRSPFICWALFS